MHAVYQMLHEPMFWNSKLTILWIINWKIHMM